MNQREKITVIVGVLIAVTVLGWRLLRSDPTLATSDTNTIPGAIGRIQLGETLHASVEGLARELTVAIPQASLAEQESAIRTDLARKAQELGIQLVSQKGIESAARGGVSKSVQMLQYRLEMNGQFDAFMKFINAVEKSPIPYTIREVNFQGVVQPTSQGGRPGGQPGQMPQQMQQQQMQQQMMQQQMMQQQQMAARGQGGGGGETIVRLPDGKTLAFSTLPPPLREKAEKYLRDKKAAAAVSAISATPPGGAPPMPPPQMSGGGGGGPMQNLGNGRVIVTMRIQSYLFPADATGARYPATGTARSDQSFSGSPGSLTSTTAPGYPRSYVATTSASRNAADVGATNQNNARPSTGTNVNPAPEQRP